MSNKHLSALGGKSFEGLKLTNDHGAEYWSARDLQPLLGYSQWRRFEQAVERAIHPVMSQEITQDTILPAPAKWLNWGRAVCA